jgi:hypothetical protein
MAGRVAAIVTRIILAVAGGYAVASGLVALLAVGLPPVTGMARSEAVVLASMLGFLIYLGLLLWGFAERRLALLFVTFLILSAGSFGLVAFINRGVG